MNSESDGPKPATPESIPVALGDDPVREFKGGESIRFNHQIFPLGENPPRFADARPIGFLGVCLAILFADEAGRRAILGSGVIVAPGLAVTATHVISDLLPDLAAGKLSMGALGFIQGAGQSWRIRGATYIKECDICFLQLEAASPLPPDSTYYLANLTTRCPSVGESVSMFGFRAASGDFADEDHQLAFKGGAGIVRAWHMGGRDACMLPFPCIEVDCPTLGGMSGGPVFDSRGYLFGMITASMHSPVPEDSSPTYASLLWPVLAQKVQSLWPVNLMKQPTSLLELGALTIPMCAIEGAAAVSQDSSGTTLYNIWS